jgi:MraZ protein
MFTGTYENSIDGKNRMIIPSKYRNQLGGKCMLSRGFDACLYIYTMEDWEELVEKMKKLRQTDRDMRRFIREFFSNASECQLDSQGRILIPQNLKTYAGITKDLITLGAMDKIEVWSKEVYNDSETENMFDDEEFIAKLEEYDI